MAVRLSTFVATALLGLGVGLTSPAHAETHKEIDASADVVVFDEEFQGSPSPDNTNTDVVKSVIKHKRARVVIKVKLRDLARLGRYEVFQVVADIKSNRPRQFLLTSRAGSQTDLLIFRGVKQLKCPRATTQLSAAKDLYKLSVPRSCLGNPRWIKVALSVYTSEATGRYADDALRSAPADLFAPRGFSPKLGRG